MKSRILLFLAIAACCAAQLRPIAVRGSVCALDGKVFVDTAAVTPINFGVPTMLPTGSASVGSGNVSLVKAPFTTVTGGDLRTLLEVFGDTGAMLGESWGVPSPGIEVTNVGDDEPSRLTTSDTESMVRNAVEPRATATLPIKMSDVTGLSSALSQINNSVDTLNARVIDLGTRVSDLSAAVSNLSTTVNTLADTVARLVPVPNFVDFEIRVGSIDGEPRLFAEHSAHTGFEPRSQ
ncbi:MAG: hypothetical protein ACR2JB_17715 [Bryobacteraceae bacterium]